MDDRGGRAIIAIDLLRFACAALVIAFHFGTAFALTPSQSSAILLHGLPTQPVAGTWFGWVGVELFFIISGFVIAFSAETGTTTDFIRRRALRLLPAAWLCASVTLVVLMLTAPQPGLGLAWLRSIAFWPTARWIDPSYWTLGIEVVFYLVIATGLSQPDRFAAIERRGMWIGMLSLIFWLVSTLSGVWPMMDYRLFQLLLLPQGCCFALGILTWAMARRGATRERVALAVIFYATTLVDIAARSSGRGEAIAWRLIEPMATFTVGLAIVLLAIRLQSWLARRVPARIAVTLGLMTYPLYLIHQEVGAAVAAGAMRLLGLDYWAALVVALATVLGIAWAVATMAEPALRRVLARRRSARPPVAATAGSAELSPQPMPATQSAD